MVQNWPAIPVMLLALLNAALAQGADFSDETQVLDDLTKQSNVQVSKTEEGVRITNKERNNEARLSTNQEFTTPLVIVAQAKTDSTNIRLSYGDKGQIILNWEIHNDELRFVDPKDGRIVGVNQKGAVPKNKWVTIRWFIDKSESRVEVDGVERANIKGDFGGLSGTVGIGTLRANVTFKSLSVLRPDQEAGTPIDITIPSARVDSTTNKNGDEIERTPADQNSVQRAEFRDKPKRLMKNLTSVTSMMVRIAQDGQATGFTSDIIATVPEQSRKSEKAGVGFFRRDGDKSMKTALEEAVRAVTLRYPIWENGHIDLSFGEKFTSHGGPSAGTAFAVLMLSSLEGFSIDPKCAVTGDITVDWKVHAVGGVAAKLHGAMLDKCDIAMIPEGNTTAFTDMSMLYSQSATWDIQVFSIATLQDAVALARTDRSPRMAEAIKLFAELQTQLKRGDQATLHNPLTAKTLKQILELAPNHLSAKSVLALVDGTAPKTLSASATIYQLSVIFHPYRVALSGDSPITRDTLPNYVTVLARKRMAALRLIANKDLQPLLTDMSALIESIDGLAAKTVPMKTVIMRKENVDARFAALSSDPDFLGKLIREGY